MDFNEFLHAQALEMGLEIGRAHVCTPVTH